MCTGLIYEGPGLVRGICTSKSLRASGFAYIREAIDQRALSLPARVLSSRVDEGYFGTMAVRNLRGARVFKRREAQSPQFAERTRASPRFHSVLYEDGPHERGDSNPASRLTLSGSKP